MSEYTLISHATGMKVWTIARKLLNDDSFVHRYSTCRSRFLPFHMAFLFCGKTLVSVASNMTSFGHAELNCLRASDTRQLKLRRPVKLIVTRINSTGTLSMSRPCRHCSLIIKQRIPRARIYYTDSFGTLQEDVNIDNSHMSLSERNRRCHYSTQTDREKRSDCSGRCRNF